MTGVGKKRRKCSDCFYTRPIDTRLWSVSWIVPAIMNEEGESERSSNGQTARSLASRRIEEAEAVHDDNSYFPVGPFLSCL